MHRAKDRVCAMGGKETIVLSRVHLKGKPVGVYLSGKRLAIVSRSCGADLTGCPSRPVTTVIVLDIADRAAPTLVQKTQLDGVLVSSGIVDDQLRLVLTNSLQLPDPISIWEPDLLGEYFVYATQDEYVAPIDDQLADPSDARIRSFAADGTLIADQPLLDASDIYRSNGLPADSIITIATFDLSSNRRGPTSKAAVITGENSQIYVTTNGVYIFEAKKPDSNENGMSDNPATPTTSVWMFTLDSRLHSIELAAHEEFAGNLLDPFAIGEANGNLS
jgi:hypothetical protein